MSFTDEPAEEIETLVGLDAVAGVPRVKARHAAKRDEVTVLERKVHDVGAVHGFWDVSIETTVYSNGTRRHIIDLDTQWWDAEEIDNLIARLTEAKQYIEKENA